VILDTEKELLELALRVVGLKLTGKNEDSRKVALAILSQMNRDPPHHDQVNVPDGGHKSLEESVLEVFRSMNQHEWAFQTNLSVQTLTQHSLLHYAAILNYQCLTAFLIENHIDLSLTDRNEFTGFLP